VKIDEGQQKIKIVRTNRQSNLLGSCQSFFSLCQHHPTDWRGHKIKFLRRPPNLPAKCEEDGFAESTPLSFPTTATEMASSSPKPWLSQLFSSRPGPKFVYPPAQELRVKKHAPASGSKKARRKTSSMKKKKSQKSLQDPLKQLTITSFYAPLMRSPPGSALVKKSPSKPKHVKPHSARARRAPPLSTRPAAQSSPLSQGLVPCPSKLESEGAVWSEEARLGAPPHTIPLAPHLCGWNPPHKAKWVSKKRYRAPLTTAVPDRVAPGPKPLHIPCPGGTAQTTTTTTASFVFGNEELPLIRWGVSQGGPVLPSNPQRATKRQLRPPGEPFVRITNICRTQEKSVRIFEPANGKDADALRRLCTPPSGLCTSGFLSQSHEVADPTVSPFMSLLSFLFRSAKGRRRSTATLAKPTTGQVLFRTLGESSSVSSRGQHHKINWRWSILSRRRAPNFLFMPRRSCLCFPTRLE